jgi:Tfp pilus assembly protein PilN
VSQQINLYEPRLRPRHELATGRNVGVVALLLVVLMTALAVWTGTGAARRESEAAALQKQLVGEQERLAATVKVLAERKVSPALAAELEQAKAQLASRQEVTAVLDSGRFGNSTGFASVMTGFARQTRSDLWLTGFRVTMGGDEIEIRGRALDPATLPQYMQSLSGEPVFQGRRFAALEMQDVEPEEVPRDDPTGAAQTANVEAAPVLRLPRFVEFVLRSENVGTPTASRRGGEVGR